MASKDYRRWRGANGDEGEVQKEENLNEEGIGWFVEQLPFPTNDDSVPQLSFSSQIPVFRAPAVNTNQGQVTGEIVQQGQGTNSLTPTSGYQLDENRYLQTGELRIVFPPVNHDLSVTSARMPIVIPGNGKKSTAVPRRARSFKSRVILHATVTAVLVVMIFMVLSVAFPVDTHGHTGAFNILSPLLSMAPGQNKEAALIAAQAATATAVTQDGFETNGAGGNVKYAGVNTTLTSDQITQPTVAPTVAPVAAAGTVSDANFVDPFTAGQCTYWADYRYHQLTGYGVPWTGNADEWSYNAPGYGWIVSSTPHLYSIIVLQPGVQYAGSYGHVAVVERINSDGSVYTSNWNWLGGWMETTYVTFQPGSGVSFVWHP